MNTGFKGSTVHIAEAMIKGTATGATVSLRIMFCNENGVVHAQTNHSFAMDDEIRSTAKAFLDACKRRVEEIHFEQPSNRSTVQKVLRGIAETLSDANSTADEPGTQG